MQLQTCHSLCCDGKRQQQQQPSLNDNRDRRYVLLFLLTNRRFCFGKRSHPPIPINCVSLSPFDFSLSLSTNVILLLDNIQPLLVNIYPVFLLFFDTTRPHQRMKKGKKTRRVSRQHSNRTQKKEIKREKEKSPPVSFFFSKRNNTHGHFVRRRGERFGVQNGAAGISPDWLRFHSHVAGAE